MTAIGPRSPTRSTASAATRVGRNSNARKRFCRDPVQRRSRELEGMHAVTITHAPQHRREQKAGDENGLEITRASHHGNRFTARLIAIAEEELLGAVFPQQKGA